MHPSSEKGGRKRNYTNVYIFSALLLISFSSLLISTRSFIVDFKDVGLTTVSGIRGGIDGVASFVSRIVLSVKELAVLRREYAELLSKIERYEQLERDAAEIKSENIRLREQLGFSETLVYKHIPAKIIGRDPDNLYSSYVINKGSKDGITRNMPVIAYQNGIQGLVGKVVQVGRLESLIMPIYDGTSFVSARMSESRYEGILNGQGSADYPLIMQYLKKRAREEIQYGDLVISSGMGRVYPEGLSIGRVEKVIFQDYERSMDLEIESIIDFSRLEYVFVINQEESSIHD